MNSINLIRTSLEMSKGWIMGLAADMKDAPLTRPTPQGGNHPLWCMGHLAYSEANLVSVLCQGEPSPLEDWADLFKQGTKSLDNADAYPPFDEVIARFEEVREATLVYLDRLTDADLDKPSHAEPERAQWFGTIGKCLAIIPIHFAFHGGQIADARRAAGRGVLML